MKSYILFIYFYYVYDFSLSLTQSTKFSTLSLFLQITTFTDNYSFLVTILSVYKVLLFSQTAFD